MLCDPHQVTRDYFLVRNTRTRNHHLPPSPQGHTPEGTVRGRGRTSTSLLTRRRASRTRRGGGAAPGSGRCPGSSRPAALPWAARGQPVAAGPGPALREAAPPAGVTGRAGRCHGAACRQPQGRGRGAEPLPRRGGASPAARSGSEGRRGRELRGSGRGPAVRSGRAARGGSARAAAALPRLRLGGGGGAASRGAGAWPGPAAPLVCWAALRPVTGRSGTWPRAWSGGVEVSQGKAGVSKPFFIAWANLGKGLGH